MTLLREFHNDGRSLRQPAGERVDDSPMPLHVILGVWVFASVLGVAKWPGNNSLTGFPVTSS